MAKRKKKNNDTSGLSDRQAGNLGFGDKLWAAADKLRGNMDAAEYKHVVLGLLFRKYISDAFLGDKFPNLKAGYILDRNQDVIYITGRKL